MHPVKDLGLLIEVAAGMMDSLKSIHVYNIPRKKSATLRHKNRVRMAYLHEPRRNTLSVPAYKPAGMEKQDSWSIVRYSIGGVNIALEGECVGGINFG